MKIKTIIFFLCFFFLFSCNQYRQEKINETENRLKEKEIELRERELNLKEKELRMLDEAKRFSNTTDETSKKDLKDLYTELKKSVYIIYAYNESNGSQGSAFVIDKYGLAISNYHVFKNATNLYAENYLGNQFMITQIYDYDAENDYVLFRIGEENTMSYADIASIPAEIGNECFTIGTPRGLSFTLSKGIVSGYRRNSSLIQTTTDITHGSSGGPLLNENGEVIGITTKGVGEGNLNFAVNIKELPIEKYKNIKPYTVQSSIARNWTEKELMDFVYRYYETLSDKDYASLATFYKPHMYRYYSKYNISVDEVIDLAKDYNKTFNIRKVNHKIRWDTFRVKRIDGYYVLDYVMDYSLDRYDRNKDSYFVLHIVMLLDANSKIVSVYENILDKA
ncbi:serine protease [Myroides sp. DW712]|uniref:S1 family peptidase n=1 Tax=Myroides sp. DW712 TaxID=3389800 RepID=UPI00397B420B